MENFDEFIAGEIIEDKNSGLNYPVGIAVHGERIHFMHYPDFDNALLKWNERKARINQNNMAIMLTENIFGTQSITGKRFIDQFDYVEYINDLII